MSYRSLSRRRLLSACAAGAAAFSLPEWFMAEAMAQPAVTRPAGANDKPSIGLIGCGGRRR